MIGFCMKQAPITLSCTICTPPNALGCTKLILCFFARFLPHFREKTKFNETRCFVKLQWNFFYPTCKWFKNCITLREHFRHVTDQLRSLTRKSETWPKMTPDVFCGFTPFVFFRGFVFFIKLMEDQIDGGPNWWEDQTDGGQIWFLSWN